MKEGKNISKKPSVQVLTLSLLAAAAVAVASLETLSDVLGPQGIIALLAGASVCLIALVIRCFPGGFPGEHNRRAALYCMLLIHILALFLFFPPDVLVNEKPVVTLDHAVHYYQVERVRSVFWGRWQMNSYDPNFMAGYPGGVLFDVDMKGAELFCALLSPLSAPRAMKLYIFLCYATIIFTVYRGSRLLGFSAGESLAGLALLLGFWNAGRPYAGAFRYAGMFSFIFVIHLSFYVIGLFRSFWRRGSKARFFIVGPLAFMVHPTAVVLMPAAFIGIMAMDIGRFRSVRPVLLLFWCLVVAAINAMWLVPLIRYLDVKTPSTAFFQMAGLLEAARLVMQPGSIPAAVLVLFGCGGMLKLAYERRFSILVPVAAAAVSLLLIAGYGCRIRLINQMEPGRFLLSFLFFLAPLAGAGLHGLMKTVESRFPSTGVRWKYGITAMLLIAPLWLSFVESRTLYKHTITARLPETLMPLVKIVRERSDMPGRMMVEDGPAALYGNAHLPGMLPLLTGREQIGGPYPYTFLLHHHSSFMGDWAFGKPLAAFSTEEFDSCLAAYNVRLILSATEGARRLLETIPSVNLVSRSGRYSLWNVQGDFGPAFAADVQVSASQNRIVVRGGENYPRVVLKYHWDKGLHVAGPSKIFPEKVGGDPVPFLGLEACGVQEVNILYE